MSLIAIAGCPSIVVVAPFASVPCDARIWLISASMSVSGAEAAEPLGARGDVEPLAGEELAAARSCVVDQEALRRLEVDLLADPDDVEAEPADRDVAGAALAPDELQVERDRRAAARAGADDVDARRGGDRRLHRRDDLVRASSTATPLSAAVVVCAGRRRGRALAAAAAHEEHGDRSERASQREPHRTRLLHVAARFSSPIGSIGAVNASGIHHLGVAVADLDEAVETLPAPVRRRARAARDARRPGRRDGAPARRRRPDRAARLARARHAGRAVPRAARARDAPRRLRGRRRRGRARAAGRAGRRADRRDARAGA